MEEQIISELKKQNLTISQLAIRVSAERHTVAKYLEKLESSGLVKYSPKGKSKIYSLTNPLLELFQGQGELNSQIKEILSLVDNHISVQTKDFKVVWNNKVESKGHCYELYANRSDICPNCPADKVFETNTKHVQIISGMGEVEIHPIVNNGETIAVVEIARKI